MWLCEGKITKLFPDIFPCFWAMKLEFGNFSLVVFWRMCFVHEVIGFVFEIDTPKTVATSNAVFRVETVVTITTIDEVLPIETFVTIETLIEILRIVDKTAIDDIFTVLEEFGVVAFFTVL